MTKKKTTKKKTATIKITCVCDAKLKLDELADGFQNAFGGVCPECQREWFVDWMEKEE